MTTELDKMEQEENKLSWNEKDRYGDDKRIYFDENFDLYVDKKNPYDNRSYNEYKIPCGEELKKIIEKKAKHMQKEVEEKSKLCEQELKEKNEIVSNLNIEISNLKSNEELLLKQIESSKQETQNKIEAVEEKFKDFLIRRHLKNNKKYKIKKIDFLMDLIDEVDCVNKGKLEFKESEEEEEEEVETEEEPALETRELSEYREGYVCVCGNEKRGGAKGCPECHKRSDSKRNKYKISMGDAWKKVWEEHGINMEENIEN